MRQEARLTDLIKDVEWSRVALLDSEDEGESDDGLLAAGQGPHVGELVAVAEADQDRQADSLFFVGQVRRRR